MLPDYYFNPINKMPKFCPICDEELSVMVCFLNFKLSCLNTEHEYLIIFSSQDSQFKIVSESIHLSNRFSIMSYPFSTSAIKHLILTPNKSFFTSKSDKSSSKLPAQILNQFVSFYNFS